MRPIDIDRDKKRLLCAVGLTAILYAAFGATFALRSPWGAGSGPNESALRPALRLTLSGASPARPEAVAPAASAPVAAISSEESAVEASAVETSASEASAADSTVGADSAKLSPGSDDSPQTGLGVSGLDEEAAFRGWLDEAIRAGLSYPESARRRGIEGTVILTITVSGDGASCAVSVSQGSGSRALDQDALRFVKSLFPSPIAPGKEFTTPVKIQYLLKKR